MVTSPSSTEHKINPVVYSKDGCPPCVMVKKYFASRGITYTERNIKDPKWRDKLAEDYHVTMVPVVVFSPDPRHVVVGYNMGRMAEIIRQL